MYILKDLKNKKSPFFGKIHSEETRQKISNALKGKKRSLETRKRMSEARKKWYRNNPNGLNRKGINSPNWRGGRKRHKNYMLIYKPEHSCVDKRGYVAEHRFIAERILGRNLKSNEIVHHINENSLDNRSCNLLICSIGYHFSLHRKMERLRREYEFT